MSGALDGLLVADFSRVLAGPYATMLLADLGADVVKVERPGAGDDTRAWGPPWGPDGQSTYFTGVNRGKRSIALDLTDARDRNRAQALAQRADVMVENFQPGALARYGLGYDDVARSNARIVYCSVSGFGAGPGAAMPGYDLMVQAMGGLMSITGHDEPTKTGVAVADVLTGLHATVAILAALRHRDATGTGQHVEVSLMSALLSSLVNQSAAVVGAGVVPGLLGNAHPSISPYESYPTADRSMVIAVGNDRQFRALVTTLDLPALSEDPRFATNTERVRHRHELNAYLVPALAHRGADEWHRLLLAAGVPNGPINDIAQALDLATELDLEPVVEIVGPDGAQHHVANPARYSRTPVTYPRPAPAVGADTDDVVAELGLDRP